MYDTHIQTSVSIRGHIVFLEYTVTPEWAVEWWLNAGVYNCEEAGAATALDLMQTLLRTYEHKDIEQILLSEFEDRQYHQEQAITKAVNEEDIDF